MTQVLTLILVISTTFLFAQSGSQVDRIRGVVQEINKDATLKKRLENEQFMEHMSDGGGSIEGYFKKDQLVKVVEWIGLSSCIRIFEFYLQDDRVIFVCGQEKVFPYNDSTNTFDHNTQKVSMESRFYFANGKLIKSVFTGHPRCSEEPSDAQVPELLERVRGYSKLLKK